MTVVAVAVALVCAPGAHARPGDYAKRVARELSDLQKFRCDGDAWEAILADPELSTLSSAERSSAYLAPVICGTAGPRRADLIARATAEPDAGSRAWSVRFLYAAAAKDNGEALTSLEAAAARSADAAASLYDDRVVFAYWYAIRDNPEVRRRTIIAIDRLDWRPVSPLRTPDFIWYSYAAYLLDIRDEASASRVAKKITLPGALIRMRLDLRFDAIVAADPEHFDISRAMQATLAADRAQLNAKPVDAWAFAELARDLRRLGHFQDALKVLDGALEKRGPLLSEGQDQRNWLANDRAYALQDLGRFDESIAAMRAAQALKEDSSPNISQTINLADLLLSAGRAAEALEMLKPFPNSLDASPYGDMWVESARACALAALGRIPEAYTSMAYVTRHMADNQAAYLRTAICLNDLDGAAANLIARLQSPDLRGETLASLSDYTIETPLTEYGKMYDERFKEVRLRPDVKTAVEAVGRMETFPFNSSALSN